jgi:sugar phosphate isomerase/epimerase
MFFSGIADEAGKPIAVQIKAQQELGWSHIEIRNVDGVNLTDLPDDAFDRVYAAVTGGGLAVSCFASQLANWARPISGDFAVDMAELERAIPRMRRFGTRFIRCMSWPNDKEDPWPEGRWREEVIARMRRLASVAEEGGVVLVHENCDGWAGQGPEQTLELVREVDSPSLKLVFDTGNPAHHDQNGWEYYRSVKEHIVYIHIKDYKQHEGELSACFPGEGIGCVKEIVADLLAGGYDGGFSIEPHLAAVVHLAKEASDPEEAYRLYVEYGKRLERLVKGT